MLDIGRDTANSAVASEGDGREFVAAASSSSLGEDWGASGARLALSLRIVVSPEGVSREAENSPKGQLQNSRLGGRPIGSIQCVPEGGEDGDAPTDGNVQPYHTSYINERGQQKVRISGGGWRIESPQPSSASGGMRPLPGQASPIRFILSVRDALDRNDVSLPEDTCLLLKANGWRRSEYEEGLRTVLPYRLRKDESQRRLEEQLDHDTGDRRLDGNDLLETMVGMKDAAVLVSERDEARRRWKEVDRMLPSSKEGKLRTRPEEEKWGKWPGDTEPFAIERGVVVAAVGGKTKKSSWLPWPSGEGAGEEMVVVGKWTAIAS